MRAAKPKTTSRPRFYAPDLDPSLAEATLPEDESHHLVRVMRLAVGDAVSVFDGRGIEFDGRVVRATGKSAIVSLERRVDAPVIPVVQATLVQAVLKGDRMDDVVRDATMAGAARIIPVVTERTLTRMSTLDRSHARDRWKRVAISSAKQCRRATLPDISSPCEFTDWLNQPVEGQRFLMVEPSSEAGGVVSLRQVLAGGGTAISCAVGPEGGWTADEQSAARSAGCQLVSLGGLTLRADAAGLIALSLIQFALDSDL